MLAVVLALLVTAAVIVAFVLGQLLADGKWIAASDLSSHVVCGTRRFWVVDMRNAEACSLLREVLEDQHAQRESDALIEQIRRTS